MLVDLRNNSSSGRLAPTRIKYREVQCTQIVHKKSYSLYLKKKFKGVLCKSSRSGLIFARENKYIQGIFFRTRGSGAGLYTDKHCRKRKANMATVWRFRRGFTSVFSLLLRSQRWSQITDSTKKITNFQALLEVSYLEEMSLFMDDLRTSNFPVLRVEAR